LTFLQELGLSFVPLFVATDAVGTLPFILALTQNMTEAERVRTIRYATITGLGLGLAFIAIGKGVFLFLGVRMADFLIAGGLLLLILAVRHLLTGRMVDIEPGRGEIVGVVPLGTPLVVGPAVLTTLLLLVNRYSLWVVLPSFVLNLVIAYLILSRANWIANLLREGGVRATSQIASLLLAAIAVMLIRQGVVEVLGM